MTLGLAAGFREAANIQATSRLSYQKTDREAAEIGGLGLTPGSRAARKTGDSNAGLARQRLPGAWPVRRRGSRGRDRARRGQLTELRCAPSSLASRGARSYSNEPLLCPSTGCEPLRRSVASREPPPPSLGGGGGGVSLFAKRLTPTLSWTCLPPRVT